MRASDVSCTPERRICNGSNTIERIRHERSDDPLRTVRRHLFVDNRRPAKGDGPAQDTSPVFGLRIPFASPAQREGAGQVVQRAQEIWIHHAALRARTLRPPLPFRGRRPPAAGRSGRILSRAQRKRTGSRGCKAAFPTSRIGGAARLYRSSRESRRGRPDSASCIDKRLEETIVGRRDDRPAETFSHRTPQ